MKIKIKVLSVMYGNRYLTNEEKVKILAYHEQRISISNIEKLIKRHKSTISRFLRNPEKYDRNKRTGRPPKVTKRDIRTILLEASNGKCSAKQIKVNQDLPVCTRRVQQIISD